MYNVYNELKLMLDGNWKYEERTSADNEPFILILYAGDIITIYPADSGKGLEIYYKDCITQKVYEFERETATSTFKLIDDIVYTIF